MAGSSQSQHLAQLRALAQSHLTQIAAEKAQENLQLTQAEAEIQRYSKLSSMERKRLANTTSKSAQQDSRPLSVSPTAVAAASLGGPNTTRSKQARLRPFSETLHRLQWDPKLNIDEYVVGYLERFEGIKEMPARSWIRDFSEEEWIPMHRARYVKRVRKEEGDGMVDEGPEIGVVWDRDGRIDRFARVGDEDAWEEEDTFSVEGMSVTGGVSILQ